MKKLLIPILLLATATPTTPMAPVGKIIKKYTKPALQLTTGAASLALAAYGAYRYGSIPTVAELIAITLKPFKDINFAQFYPASTVSILNTKNLSISQTKDFNGKVRYLINQNGVKIEVGDNCKNLQLDNGIVVNTSKNSIQVVGTGVNIDTSKGLSIEFDGPVEGLTIENLKVNCTSHPDIDFDAASKNFTTNARSHIFNAIAANPLVIGTAAFTGTLLVYCGIKNFKKAYKRS